MTNGFIKNYRSYRKYYLAILFAVVLILMPMYPAKAFSAGWFGIGSLAYDAVVNIFAYVTFIIFTITGRIIALLIIGLQIVINIPVYPDKGIAVIDESWKIMRNFANMFFIVALIMMAFATIFDVVPGLSKYNARALFGKFLFTALLINFSLVLGVLVIQGTQVLNNTFLIAMGDMSGRLGQNLNPANLITPDRTTFSTAFQSVDQQVSGTLITLIFSLVLMFTFLFSLLTAFIFALIRIPILWALLIVSPIAWILNIFPAGEGTFKKWWHTFIGWNMFLPIFLFFLYFGLYFLNNQEAVIAAIAKQSANQSLGTGVPNFFQLLFFYVLAAIFLIGGTIVAMKASMFSGTGVVGIAKWSKGVAARRLGLTAAGGAAKQRLAQIQEEGLPGKFGALYGGKYGLEQQTGGFAQRFGVRGAEIKNQKAFIERAGKDYTDFERQYQNGQITEEQVVSRAKQFDATDPRGFAYRKLAAKIGQLDNDTFTSTLTQLSKNPLAAEDFAKTAKESKFSKMKGKDLARMAAAESGVDVSVDPLTGVTTSTPYDYTSLRSSVAARREMFRYVLTDKKAMTVLKDEQIKAGIGVFGGHTTAEGKEFLKEVGKINPAFAVEYNLDATHNQDLVDDAKDGFNTAHGRMPTAGPAGDFELRTHMFGGFLRSGDIKDVTGIKITTIENNPEFRESLKTYISQFGTDRARRSYVQQLERTLLNTPGGDRKWDLLRNGRGVPTDPNYIPPTIGDHYDNVTLHPRRSLVPPAGVTPPLG